MQAAATFSAGVRRDRMAVRRRGQRALEGGDLVVLNRAVTLADGLLDSGAGLADAVKCAIGLAMLPAVRASVRQ